MFVYTLISYWLIGFKKKKKSQSCCVGGYHHLWDLLYAYDKNAGVFLVGSMRCVNLLADRDAHSF